MYNAVGWRRIYYRVGVGQVDEGAEYDFSFSVKHLQYTENTAFQAVYLKALSAAPFERVETLVSELSVAIRNDEARRVEIMRTAKESGTTVDVGQLTTDKGVTDLFVALHKAKLEANQMFCESIPKDWLLGVFERYVRDVRDLSRDGEPVTDGVGLYELADDPLTATVLRVLNQGASLSSAEGKVSSSLSTSPQGDETVAGE